MARIRTKSIAQRVVEFRKTHPIKHERPMSVREFAKRSGLSRSQVSAIEHDCPITWKVAERLAAILRMKPEALVTRGSAK